LEAKEGSDIPRTVVPCVLSLAPISAAPRSTNIELIPKHNKPGLLLSDIHRAGGTN